MTSIHNHCCLTMEAVFSVCELGIDPIQVVYLVYINFI